MKQTFRVMGGLVLIAAMAFVPPAVADLSSIQTLSRAGANAWWPQVAVDADGNAVVVWERYDGMNWRIQARARAADGTLSPVETLSGAGLSAHLPQVAMDPSGTAVIVWERTDGTNVRIQARARSAAGVLSAVQTLSPAGSDAARPQVAVDPNGNAVFVWENSTTARIQTRARSAAGALSALQTLSVPGGIPLFPQVGVDADGNAVYSWERLDGTNYRIETRTRSAGGALGAGRILSPAGQDASRSQVAVYPDGAAVFVWRRSDGTYYRVQARAVSASGTLSNVQTLSAPGQNAEEPQVAASPMGPAVFTWQRHDGTNVRVQGRVRSMSGVLSDIVTLSPAGQDATTPQVGVDASGDAVFVWQRSDGADLRAQARARSATGVLSPLQNLSAAGGDVYIPQVAVDPNGNAVFIWQWNADAPDRIQVRARSAM